MIAFANKRLLTLDEYHRMLESGILADDERVELVRGEIFELTPIGNRHAACLRRLLRLLGAGLGPDLLLDAQNPVVLTGQGSQPQPDLVLLRGREDGYAERPPAAEDVLLVVEISDHSLAYDRDVKIPLYAEAGIPEAWLVDLPGGAVAVHRNPAFGVYQDVRRLRRGDVFEALARPGLRLRVDSILG
ncbi:MAG: Uma2 family endonuclease [Acidobacteriota bacterium]